MANKLKIFKKGEIIFREGDQESCMYALIKGVVGIYTNYEKPGEALLVELKEEDGATFGEMGLIDSMPRSATAVALEDGEAIVVTGETFGDYFREKPETILFIMQNMSTRIRELTEDYLEACRAVAEAVECEKTGKEKSSWFKKAVDKFVGDYNDAANGVSSVPLYYREYDLDMTDELRNPYKYL